MKNKTHSRHHLRAHSSRNKGFTLIELLVVIAIIAILASVVLSSLTSARRKADDTRRDEDMRNMKSALELYGSKHNYDYSALVTGFTTFSFNNNETHYAHSEPQTLLSLTTKVAYAQTYTDAGCQNFKLLAEKLVEEDFLKSVPVDPNDSTSGSSCYHAYSALNTNTNNLIIAGYAIKWEKYTKTEVSNFNKKTGFIISSFGEDNIEYFACSQFNYPAITPSTSGNSCIANASGYIADSVSGITPGKEEVDSGNNGGGGGGTCSNSQYTTQSTCEADHSYCSDNTYTSQESCLGVGSCSNPGYTTKSQCESAGDCTGGGYGDSNSCTSHGDCTNGYTNITSDECSSYNSGGSCSNASFGSDESTCTSHGYCSNGSDGVTSSDCSTMNTGYCSDGGYGSESECTSYGNCSNGNYNVQQSSCNGSYGYCSGGSYDENSCPNYGDCYITEYGYSYTNVDSEWCNSNSGSFSGYSWINMGSDTWTSYTWNWNTMYTWNPYTWTSGTTYSWSPYTWSGATWTSTNSWTSVPGSTWTSN